MKPQMPFTRSELDQLLNYSMVLCADRDDALDLLQGGIEKYLLNGPVDVVQPLAYLRRIIRNLFIDQQRRNKIVEFESLDSDQQYPAVNERDIAGMLIDEAELEYIWTKLTAAEREVVYLWGVEGMTVSEIALQLGQPRSTVLTRLHRMRTRLAQKFPALGGERHD